MLGFEERLFRQNNDKFPLYNLSWIHYFKVYAKKDLQKSIKLLELISKSDEQESLIFFIFIHLAIHQQQIKKSSINQKRKKNIFDNDEDNLIIVINVNFYTPSIYQNMCLFLKEYDYLN